jgi:hypothetical protein
MKKLIQNKTNNRFLTELENKLVERIGKQFEQFDKEIWKDLELDICLAILNDIWWNIGYRLEYKIRRKLNE